MNTVENAYEMIAQSILDFIRGREWDKGECVCKIYRNMASSSCSYEFEGQINRTALGWPTQGLSAGDAALFLRDDLLSATGERIWGLTFVLFPDGKFRIDYDYDKPEDYDETEESVGGD